MNNVDKQYLDLLQDILDNGSFKETRSGDVLSVFGRTMRFDLKKGLPILTTKKVFTKGIIHELLWFLKGDTNIKYLVDNKVNIWTDDAYRWFKEKYPHKTDTKEEFVENVKQGVIVDNEYRYGDLGPIYGKQWRKYGISNTDQIKYIVNTLKTNPYDRRMLLLGWNPDVLNEIALPACHTIYQFYARPLSNIERLDWLCQHSTDNKYDEWKTASTETLNKLKVPQFELSCSFFCRSQDYLLGNPYNITSASILTHMIAECVNMSVGEVIWNGGDVHVYCNQIELARKQLERKGFDTLPNLKFARKITDIDDFKYEDFIIENYKSEEAIKYPLSVG